jgi:hypothetical protein
MATLSSLAVLAALGACNSVFSLEPAGLHPESDSDLDGVNDADDNCALVPNRDQADLDLDSLGDACDPCIDGPQTGRDDDHDGVDDGCDLCLSGLNHDEDLDGFADGCDVCPGVADDQADGDGDGVGDACDPDPLTPQHRVFFDGFGPPRSSWEEGFTPWHGTTDGYAPDDPSMGNPVEGPWSSDALVGGRGVRVVASVLVPSPQLISDFQFLGVNLRRSSDGHAIEGCTISVQGATWEALGNPNPIAPGALTLVLDFHPATNPAYVNVGCTVAGVLYVNTNVAFDPTQAYVPSLLTTIPAEFEWIDVLE